MSALHACGSGDHEPRLQRWRDCTEQAQRAIKERSVLPIVTCAQCGDTRTSLLRVGPSGERTLCNKCGLLYSKLERRLQDPAWSRKRVSIQSLVHDGDTQPAPATQRRKKLRPPGFAKTRMQVFPVFKLYYPPTTNASSDST